MAKLMTWLQSPKSSSLSSRPCRLQEEDEILTKGKGVHASVQLRVLGFRV